jgi:hypothetical protein
MQEVNTIIRETAQLNTKAPLEDKSGAFMFKEKLTRLKARSRPPLARRIGVI